MKASQLIDLIVWYNYVRIRNKFSEESVLIPNCKIYT